MLTATDEKIWVLDKDTYSVSWPADSKSWLLEKTDLETVDNVVRALIAAINVDNYEDGSDFGYVFLLIDIAQVLKDMLENDAVFAVPIIGRPFRIKLPHTIITVPCKDADISRIENSLFYFFARLLVQWPEDEITSHRTPDQRLSNNYPGQIKKLISEYRLNKPKNEL